MKAILIDPVRREVKGISVEMPDIRSLYKGAMLLQAMIGFDRVMYHAGNGPETMQAFFWFKGLNQVVYGKGLLLGRNKGQWPIATTLTVREVECLVRFLS